MTFRQIAVSVTRTIRKLTATKQSFAIVGFWPIAVHPALPAVCPVDRMRSAHLRKPANA